MAVTKIKFAQRLADRLDLSKKQALDFVDTFTDEVVRVLKEGEKVNITGFGIFKVVDRKARKGRNPMTGEEIDIAASRKPRFTPSKALKESFKL